MKLLGIHLILVFFSIGNLLHATVVPHQNREFLIRLSNSMQSIENDFVNNTVQTSRSGRLLQSLLKNFIKEKIVQKDTVLNSLDNFSELKNKLLKIKGEGSEKITVLDLLKILKGDFKGLNDKEKEAVRNQLIALLLSEFRKTGNPAASLEDKMKDVIVDYLKSAGRLDPNQPLALSNDLKKALGLNEQNKPEDFYPGNILKKLRERGSLSPNLSLDLLSNLAKNSLENIESLDRAFLPIYNSLYRSLVESTPNRMAIPNGGFQSALDLIGTIRNEPIQPINPPSDFRREIPLSPIRGHQNGSSGFSAPSGGNRFRGNGRSGRSGGRSISGSGRIPGVQDTEELKACLDSAKQKRFNVELKLPGALCASTAVSQNPAAELASFNERQSGDQCTVKLATAVHCIEGRQLSGTIGTRIDGRTVNATVIQSGSVDGVNGQAVANGNPDLAMIVVSLPCETAKKINFARIPTASELRELTERQSVPVIMQQNSEINASIQGVNAATIAGQGTFERFTDGRIGNFLRFNSNSRFNNSSNNTGDSSRIRQGDSGGAALTCKVTTDNQVIDHIYLGAISHIDVTGDQFEGRIGGIASGQSLANLSRLFHGNAPAENSLGRGLVSRLESAPSHYEPSFSHNN